MSQNPAYGKDSFGRPKLVSESQSIVNNIMTILFGRPGFFPSQPELGMDINQYLYSLEDDIDVNSIKQQLIMQCSSLKEVVNEGSFDVVVSHYNGNPVLLFQLPIVTETEYKDLILGISLSDSGELVYNFTFNDDDVGSI